MSLLAMFAVGNVSFLTGADRFVQDWEIAFRSPPEPQDPNILILAVDEPTMQHFPYRSPLDRGFLAQLLTALDAKHPRAIVLDYLFDQPTEKDKDDALRTALRNMKTPLVVSYFETGGRSAPEQIGYLNAFVPPNMRALANVGTDQTDTARWIVPGGTTSTGEYLLSVPRRLAQLAGVETPNEQVPIVWRADPGEEPAGLRGNSRLRLRPADLPADRLDPSRAMFKNKIVLIGSDLTLVDHHRTPFATDPASTKATMPGIVIQANALSQLLHHRDPPQLSWWANFLIALVFAGSARGSACSTISSCCAPSRSLA